MIQSPFLKEGNKVVIVSTARKIAEKELNFAANKLEEWGLNVVFGKHLFDEHNQFAGNDEMRISDFQEALDDESVAAIVCARGGYGSVRIVDSLDFTAFSKSPKWIVGYSDVTVLHSHIATNVNAATIHGTMPINFASNTKQALDSLRDTLFGKKLTYEVESHDLNRTGSCEGLVIGGNLSILYSLIGSPSDIDTEGKILFIEDLDEYLYHIDRMMQSLKRSGKLSNLAGLIVGAMSDMNDNPVPFGKSANEIISAVISDYDYPVCFNFPLGHVKDNRALYVNKKANLVVGSSTRISYV